MIRFKAIPVSPGIALGHVFKIPASKPPVSDHILCPPEVEWQHFLDARALASKQLNDIFELARKETSDVEAGIFQAHIQILEDPDLAEKIFAYITEKKISALDAVIEATEFYARSLDEKKDEYLRARAADIRDIAKRMLRILNGEVEAVFENLVVPSIILAEELTPSDTITLDRNLSLGFCSVKGGATSHTAIIARSMGLPAVVGLPEQAMDIDTTEMMILDGDEGMVIYNPDEEILNSYLQKIQHHSNFQQNCESRCSEDARTIDGVYVEVAANIGNASQAREALSKGADGVGLLRTEFLYLERSNLPDEDEQYAAYREILDAIQGKPVILRTLDAGGDKDIPYIHAPKEMNPFLGVRAIRLCLKYPEKLFKPQIKAALRAAQNNHLKIMFPMIATIGEFREAKRLIRECRAELEEKGFSIGEVSTGIMVEIPATAIMAEQFAREVDFFSIGTNDLTQYTMAVDRGNSELAHLSNAFEPSVLKLIKSIVDAAHRYGKWVGVCGELAGEILAVPILVGFGVDELSMNAPLIPAAKQVIRSFTIKWARDLAVEALKKESGTQVKEFVRDAVDFPIF